jgi:hypothetical protein
MAATDASSSADSTAVSMSVSGRELHFRSATMPVAQLHLDTTNPRLRDLALKAETEGRALTEPEIEKRLWEEAAVKKLYTSIVASGGLTEQLWVYRDGRVPEGNERLVCLRKIERDLKGPNRYKIFTEANAKRMETLIAKVPVKIVPEEITDSEMDILLARLHVSGKDEWPTFNQAAHVYKMNHDDGIDVERIAELLTVSTTWVYMRLKAYEWTKAYLETTKSEDLSVYSTFEEAYKVKAKLRKVGLDLDKEEDMEIFQKMIRSKNIGWAIHVRKLPKLLEQPQTRKLVLQGKVQEAHEILPQFDPSEFSPRLGALVKAKDALSKLDREDMRMIKENVEYRKLLENLAKDLNNVVAQAMRS